MTVPDVVELREGARRRAAGRPRGPELASVRDVRGPDGVALRHYRPAPQPRPLLVVRRVQNQLVPVPLYQPGRF
ncbi:hypothetical protein [Nonomuraea terrae]|uniref:hypothetical protein n=1 Tax=Nonomuraea terrae TaxID=2530383 RepID=UPI0014055690|nr:hypothetical protein [Nonomuraea terrae]